MTTMLPVQGSGSLSAALGVDYGALAPLFIILGAACVSVLVEAFVPLARRAGAQLVLCLAAIVVALVLVIVRAVERDPRDDRARRVAVGRRREPVPLGHAARPRDPVAADDRRPLGRGRRRVRRRPRGARRGAGAGPGPDLGHRGRPGLRRRRRRRPDRRPLVPRRPGAPAGDAHRGLPVRAVRAGRHARVLRGERPADDVRRPRGAQPAALPALRAGAPPPGALPGGGGQVLPARRVRVGVLPLRRGPALRLRRLGAALRHRGRGRGRACARTRCCSAGSRCSSSG